jgi:hypothetical protein
LHTETLRFSIKSHHEELEDQAGPRTDMCFSRSHFVGSALKPRKLTGIGIMSAYLPYNSV